MKSVTIAASISAAALLLGACTAPAGDTAPADGSAPAGTLPADEAPADPEGDDSPAGEMDEDTAIGDAADPTAALEGLALADTEAGYTLLPQSSPFGIEEQVEFEFAVLGPDGVPVDADRVADGEFTVTLVSHDLEELRRATADTGQDADVWVAAVDLRYEGTWRAVVDGTVDGVDRVLLGTDVTVGAGSSLAVPSFDEERRLFDDGSYQVELSGRPQSDAPQPVTVTVFEEGTAIDHGGELAVVGFLADADDAAAQRAAVLPEVATIGSDGTAEVLLPAMPAGRWLLFVDADLAGDTHRFELVVTSS